MGNLVVMPKLGLTMTEGQLVKWHKSEGDEIKSGEILFDVTTDKLTNEIEATVEGIIRKLLVKEGEVVECLRPVAIIGRADEDISSLLGEASPENKEEKIENETQVLKPQAEDKGVVKREGRIKISPAARKLAKENDITIEFIPGTGPEGRIVLEDVRKYIEESKNITKASPMAVKMAKDLGININEINKDSRIMKEDILQSCNSGSPEAENAVEKRVKMSSMRKVISSRMSHSWSVSPAVTYDIKVDTSSLKRVREQLKDVCKVTYTDLLVKIVSKALLEFPLLNCKVDGEDLIIRNYVNMGVAVALEEGLVVPVIKNANQKGLRDISAEIKEMALKAKNNELTSDNLTGGTFTITNLGMLGIEYFSPIINQPEVAILGVNKITETPVVENEQVIIKSLMNLSLTADHRAVDGSVAAQFLARVKDYMEKPELLLL